VDTGSETQRQPSEKASGSKVSFRSVEKWDYRSTSGVSEDIVRKIGQLHQPLCRTLSRSLGISLNTTTEIEVGETREITYGEFESALAPNYFLGCFRLDSQPSPVLIHMDTTVVFPILEILLGGTAETPCERAELSDIDTRVLSDTSRMVSHELQLFWRDDKLRFRPDAVFGKAARYVLPGSSKLLILPFNIKLGEASGVISVLLPSSLTKLVVDALDIHSHKSDKGSGPTLGKNCADKLNQIPVLTELVWPSLRLPVRVLSALTPNSVLPMPVPVGQFATVKVAGKNLFQALPARSSLRRAARIERPISDSNSNEEKSQCQ
jgi:flagellar motor switch protein FliM